MRLWLPIESIQENVQWFIDAILALPDKRAQVSIRKLIHCEAGYDHLYLYLLCHQHCRKDQAQQITDRVNQGLQDAEIPFVYEE